MALKKGDTVKQVIHPIEGVIDSKRFNEDSDSFEYLVTYKDETGADTGRWFTETDIEKKGA